MEAVTEKPFQITEGSVDTKSVGDVQNPPAPPSPELPAKPTGPPPPPDGGLVAWLHVLGGFFLFFNSWGLFNTFGVFQAYYESGELFVRNSADIAWIGSLAGFFLLGSGIVAGPLYDRGYMRAILSVGTIAISLGYMMLSLCTEYWQVLLAQGLCAGIGGGCFFVCIISILPTYFRAHLAVATGIAASGSSLGGVIYPLVLSRMLETVGFPWATRVLGFIVFGTSVIPLVTLRMRFIPPKARSPIDKTVFTDIQFLSFTLATTLLTAAVCLCFFYLAYYSVEHDWTSETQGRNLVAIYNAASCIGRILPSYLADRIGLFNVLVPAGLANALLLFCMAGIKNEAGVIVLTVLNGFFCGVQIAMPPVVFAAMTKDKTRLGARLGTGLGVVAVGVLVFSPIGGAILDSGSGGHWTGLWVFVGVAASLGFLGYSAIRMVRADWQWWVPV